MELIIAVFLYFVISKHLYFLLPLFNYLKKVFFRIQNKGDNMPKKKIQKDKQTFFFTKKFKFSILFLFILVVFATSVSAWQYYKQLNISDTGGVGADYQMKLRIYKGTGTDDPTTGTIYCNNLCLNFPKDIRFGKTSHLSTDTQLKQWIENETDEYVDIWVKLPNPAQDKIYLFIGNAEAEKYSDGNSVFLFFDDFNYFSPYDTTKWDKVGGGTITKTFETQFTASHGGQGLANDGNYFYWGRNNGNGVNGTIYKIKISNGDEVGSFPGPPHTAGGDWREDYNTLLFSSGGAEVPIVWEINASTGNKIREWNFTGEGYNRGALIAYKSSGRIYLFTSDTSSNFKIKEYQINDDGTWSGVGIEYSHSSLGTPQGLDYIDGYLYYLYDNGISKLQLNADGSISILEQLTNLDGGEKEGLTYYNNHFYYGDGTLKIRKILDEVSIDISTTHTSLYSKTPSYGSGTAIRCKWRASTTSLNYPGFGYGDKGRPDIVDDSYGSKGISIGKLHAGNAFIQGRQTNNGTNRAETGSLLSSSDQNTFHIYEIRRKASSSEFAVDDGISTSLSGYYPTEDLYVGIGGHHSNSGQSIADWIAVRKYASPEPNWSSFGNWIFIDTISPSVYLIKPTNAAKITKALQTFTCKVMDNVQLAKASLYIWNSSDNLVCSSTKLINGTVKEVSWQYALPYDDTFKWNCLAYDTSNLSNWSDDNQLLILDAPDSFVKRDLYKIIDFHPKHLTKLENLFKFEGFSSIVQLNIKAKKTLSFPGVTVEWLDSSYEQKNIPELIKDEKVYHYEKVDFHGFKDSDIKNVKIIFRVKKDWLKTNNLKIENVVIKRYDTKWNDLNTNFLKQKKEYYYFEAETNKPGYFVITSKTKQSNEETAIPNTLVHNQTNGVTNLTQEDQNSKINLPKKNGKQIKTNDVQIKDNTTKKTGLVEEKNLFETIFINLSKITEGLLKIINISFR